ncbi:MAG: glycerophosphoryl diester phosphodiesterase membrane domain-containing protein [Terracidiphilus sp.]
METTLRPLTLGEILDRTAELYRTNFLLFAGISSIYAGILLVLSLLQIGAQQAALSLHTGPNMNTGLIAVSVIGLVVLWLAIFVAGGLAVAANTRAVGWVHLGEPASIGAAYSTILPRTGRYLWLMTITYFLAWFPCVLVYGAYAALLFAYVKPKGLFSPHAPPPDPQMMVVFLASSVAFLFLLAGAMVYGIIMSLRYSLAIPACTVENLTARAAIRRSIQLSKGSRGRIFMLALLALIIQLGLTGITQGFFIVVGLKHHGVLPVWMSVMQQFLAFLTNTFVGPIYATGFTLFYYDQRVRKEGYDIERMMHNAGMTPSLPAVESNSALEDATPLDQGSGHE